MLIIRILNKKLNQVLKYIIFYNQLIFNRNFVFSFIKVLLT
jgi:hypothetical protein